eukprot:403583_1
MPTIKTGIMKGGAGFEYSVGFKRIQRKTQPDTYRIYAKYQHKFLSQQGFKTSNAYWGTYCSNKNFYLQWAEVLEYGIKQSIEEIKNDRKPCHAMTNLFRISGKNLYQMYETVHGEQYKVDEYANVWSESRQKWILSEIIQKEIDQYGIWYIIRYARSPVKKRVKMDSNEIRKCTINELKERNKKRKKMPRKGYATRTSRCDCNNCRRLIVGCLKR